MTARLRALSARLKDRWIAAADRNRQVLDDIAWAREDAARKTASAIAGAIRQGAPSRCGPGDGCPGVARCARCSAARAAQLAAELAELTGAGR